MIDLFSIDSARRKNLQELLASVSLIANPCELDLLTFLHRHPQTLLTNEQLAAFVGYDMKQIAKSIDSFINAGLLARTQNPMHAARMYLLVLEGTQGGNLKRLLELASTRQGRHEIIKFLEQSHPASHLQQSKRKLQGIA